MRTLDRKGSFSDEEIISTGREAFSGHLGPLLNIKKRSLSGGSRASSIHNEDGNCNMEMTALEIMEDPGDPVKKAHSFGPSLSRRPSAGAGVALKSLKFIANKKKGRDTSWQDVEAKFTKLTTDTDGRLHSSLFGKCICMGEESKDFGEALFFGLARRFKLTQDSIDRDQLKKFWDRIADDNFKTRLQTFFDMVDEDIDGKINEDQIKEMLRLSASANKLSRIHEQAGKYAALIMDELDRDKAGYIMVEKLHALLQQDPEQVVQGDGQCKTQPKSETLKTQEINKGWYNRLKYFITDHWQRLWVIMLWLAVCCALFIYKFAQYKNRDDSFAIMGYCVCVAKGAGETLKLNMALVLLPVCRNTITWLRNKTTLGVVVPFDDNINFHQVISIGIIVGVVLHAGAHLTCDFPRVLIARDQKYEEHLARYFGEERPVNYWWFVKGWEGVTGIVMILLMVVAFTLASPDLRTGMLKKKLKKLKKWKILPEALTIMSGFNVFWYSHHLFVIVYALLVIHGTKLYLVTDTWEKTTWMYIAVPIMLYVIERLIRAFRSTIEQVKIVEAVHYPGRVLALKMSKPPGFKYKSGQYMFLNCPTVSPFEWHPFSITSAPLEDHLGVHIRVLGDWTEEIKNVFLQANHPDGIEPRYPEIQIDGAYGAPAQDYKKYDIVLLIGLGIGATPMISIVKDINDNMRTMKEEGQALENGTSPATKKRKDEFKTKRAYFYWVTQDDTFEWFKVIMNQVAEIDEGKIIEMHNYCSNVYEESDARAGLIAALQSLYYAKNGEDVVSKLRVKAHFARPNWPEVYRKIAADNPNTTVGVFYCGLADPVKDLKHLASEFSHTTTTKFVFHKENF